MLGASTVLELIYLLIIKVTLIDMLYYVFEMINVIWVAESKVAIQKSQFL